MRRWMGGALGLALAGVVLANGAAFGDGMNYGSSDFLSQGVGARATGMGGAFVAVADDVTAGYWNPAGLSQMELYLYEVGAQYSFMSNQMSMSYLSYAFQIPNLGNFEVSWINWGVTGIEGRNENEEETGSFSATDNAVVFSYGRKVYEWLKGLSVGVNAKFLSSSLQNYSASGFGFDLGALWQPVLYWDHTIGLNVQNLLQRDYWNGGSEASDSSLVNAKLGAAFRFFRSPEDIYFDHWVNTVDLELSEYSRFNIRAGSEYWYTQSLGFRAGYDGSALTFGASYAPEFYEIDYSFHYDLTPMANNQHWLSVMVRLK